MDELTLLRSTRDDGIRASAATVQAGHEALMARIAEPPMPHAARRLERPSLAPRLGWATAGLAAIAVTALALGNLTDGGEGRRGGDGGPVLEAAPVSASDILLAAAVETRERPDPVPGQYLRARTHAQWAVCHDPTPNIAPESADPDATPPPDDGAPQVCEPGAREVIEVYMPGDPSAEWVLLRDGGAPGGRALGGKFYGEGSWLPVDIAEIPLDGASAYAWVDASYQGTSASRDEANFKRIAEILLTGLVPAGPRAALLDALSRIPGVTATPGVANLDGVVGVAIGREEPERKGQRWEIIIDPATGLVIGEFMTGSVEGVYVAEGPLAHTAIETTVVEVAP